MVVVVVVVAIIIIIIMIITIITVIIIIVKIRECGLHIMSLLVLNHFVRINKDLFCGLSTYGTNKMKQCL